MINVLNKPLPFKDFKKNYVTATKENPNGNLFVSDNANLIIEMIMRISKRRPDIKNIIIDDFQYVMANQFMRKAKEKGFDKFVDIGQQAWRIIQESIEARNDLYIFILSHTELDSLGRSKCKTIGKMLDEKITLEGMFTIVLHSIIENGQYKFLTQNDGIHIAKSPMEMFDRSLIDNDLNIIKQRIADYIGECEPEKPINEMAIQTKPQTSTSKTQLTNTQINSVLQTELDNIPNIKELIRLETNYNRLKKQYGNDDKSMSLINNATNQQKKLIEKQNANNQQQ